MLCFVMRLPPPIDKSQSRCGIRVASSSLVTTAAEYKRVGIRFKKMSNVASI